MWELNMKSMLTGALVALTLSTGADAATLDFNFDEVNSNVVVTFEGSLDLTGLTLDRDFFQSGRASSFIDPAGARFRGSQLDLYTVNVYTSMGDSFRSFGTGGTVGMSVFGLLQPSYIAFDDDELSLISGYSSGATIRGGLRASGSFASLGIDDTPQSFAFGENTINYNFNGETAASAAVPVPAALPLLLSAIAGLAFFSRRRRV